MSACTSIAAEPQLPEPSAVVHQELLRAVEQSAEDLHVIINFVDAQTTERALSHLEQAGVDGTITRRYRHVPAVAARVKASALEPLSQLPGVTAIQVDHPGGGQLKEAVPAIGADKVASIYGLTGKGVRVAVLDTGVATQHPDLGGAVVAQHCFTQRACPPFRTYEGTSAEDDHGHGSHVAGILASRGVVSPPGFAPDVELVAVKVSDHNDRGHESDWVSGLDWIYQHLAELEVQVVNLSIGTSAIYPDDGTCPRRHPALARAIDNLTKAGVSVFIASGNHGSGSMMPAPACLEGDAVVVGATYDSMLGPQPPGAATYYARWGGFFANCGDATTQFDQITCFTNSNGRLDIVAPGAAILSDALRNSTDAYWGTSQSAPVAAGVAALMLQCNPDLKPAEIKRAMVATGVPVVDAKNGRSFPSLRAYEAVREVCSFGSGEIEEAGVSGRRDAAAVDGVGKEDASFDAGDAEEADAHASPGEAQMPDTGGGLSGMPDGGEKQASVGRLATDGCGVRVSHSSPSGAGALLVLLGLGWRRRARRTRRPSARS